MAKSNVEKIKNIKSTSKKNNSTKAKAKALKLLSELNNYNNQERQLVIQLEKGLDFKTFEKQMKIVEKKERSAYKKYYDFMNSNFDINNNEVSFTVYKNGFIDKKFVNDIFKKQ
ncbi:MAG: hypothetical protein IJZ29_04335 [Clostridia bacterium]|nr:hypothetical protein [Clostridia bacterium]